jgi:hypothetical protein
MLSSMMKIAAGDTFVLAAVAALARRRVRLYAVSPVPTGP